MMSLSTIRQLSRDAAIRAVRDNRIPFTVEPEDLVDWRRRLKAGTLRLPFPFIGNYTPQGWKRTERDPIFCDHSGWGSESEPALTVRGLLEALTPGKAYAVIETGQFQLYLAEYERDDDSHGNEDEFVGLTSDEEQEFTAIVNPKGPDVAIRFEGTICLFDLKTEHARMWVIQHVAGPTYFGNALVVEHRFVKELARAMKADGFRLA